MTGFLHELVAAARGILSRPAFSALVVAVLAAGLACVIFMMALIEGFILRPLPFAKPDELLQAGFLGDGELGDVFPVTSTDFVQIRRQLAAVSDVAGAARSTVNLSDLERPQRYNGAHVSANLFRVLGVAPILGRDFTRDDTKPGAPAVAMLSYTLWHSRYGGDPAVIGRRIRVDGHPATVIGVMPKNFSYPRREVVWLPATLSENANADGYAYWVVLRRHAGTGDAAVSAAFERWFADAAKQDPERMRTLSPRVEPLAYMAVDRTTRATLGIMLAAVLMVLVVACANAANLLLTRTLGRGHELSVRVALGASRRRLIMNLLAESLLLSLVAAALAVWLARLGVSWQKTMMQASEFFPLWLRFEVDGAVVAASLIAALVTALLTGLLPALRAGDATIYSRLRDGAPGGGGGSFARISRVLVIGEVAMSCALLICVGTLVRGIAALDRSDLGIDTDHLLSARIALNESAYPNADAQRRLYARLADRLRRDSDVVDASVGTAFPGTYYNEVHDLVPAGTTHGDGALPQVYSGGVDDHFLGAYGIPLEEGRFFDDRDRADSERVAVVDRRFADRFGHGRSILGQRFRLDPRDPAGATVTVVGVIGPLRLDTPGYAAKPAMLLPLSQDTYRIASIAVRTRGGALAFAPRLVDVMREVDPDTPVYWVRDYPKLVRDMTVGERVVADSFGVFGVVALILAAAGLYGVVAFSVARRTHEIGVRRALGAADRRVAGDVLGRSLLQLGIGVVLGIAAGLPFARLLTRSLSTIEGTNATIVLVVVATMAIAALLAVLAPLRRALRVNPMIALRDRDAIVG